MATDNETMAKYVKLHIERGISYLSGTNFIKDLDSLLTEQPLVNTMFYEDAMERIKLREDLVVKVEKGEVNECSRRD